MLTTSVDPDPAALFAPGFESVDRRLVGYGSAGAEGVRRGQAAWRELADGLHFRIDDVLGLSVDAVLRRTTALGTLRASGGAFERSVFALTVFGADGRVTRNETFDVGREADALARFDELTARASAPAVRRRVRPNAAIANVRAVEAAVAARNADALDPLVGDNAASLDHSTGAELDRPQVLRSWRSFLSERDFTLAFEPLATLGDGLLLCLQSTSVSGVARGSFDVGPYERQAIALVEVDAEGRRRRTEYFAPRSLGDAVACLYERYAELFPDGPERTRAAATARSVAALLGAPDRWPFAPDAEATDHRTVGFGSLRGADAVVSAIRALVEQTDDWTFRIDDVLGLKSDALLVRWTTSGTIRASGGSFERLGHMLWVFGADGLVVRWEQFDIEQDAEALARFDELTTGSPSERPVRRPVQANSATAHAVRLDAAIAARDADSVARLFTDQMEAVDHIMHTTWDRQNVVSSWRSLALAEGPACRHERLATLGDSLALCRVMLCASRLVRGSFDVGGYEKTEIHLIEADAQGRRGWTEVFALDRLGDAVVRLYERYAELLPDGPDRTRAAATARSVASWAGSIDLDRYTRAFAPAIEAVDHRTLGTWSARGAEALLEHFRSSLELTDDAATRDDEVLCLRSDAFLLRRTHFGTARASGGAYERPFIALQIFGADGLTTRLEWFDVDRDAEALARFDELMAEPPAERFANAAWRALEELDHAMERRDWDAPAACYAPGSVLDDRRSMVRTRVEGEAHLAHLRFLFDAYQGRSSQLLATRGDRLVLHRQLISSAARHGGLAEFEMLDVVEVDASGRRVAVVAFDPDDLDAAYAELDERYVAGEAAPFVAVLAGARAFAAAVAARDWDSLATVLASDIVVYDHRPLGWETLHGPALLVGTWKALVELAPDVRLRIDHVMASRSGSLAAFMLLGTHEGGAFEDYRVVVHEYDGTGQIRQHDIYRIEQLDLARARFEALTASAPR